MDALFAYDSGATDSGIHDEALRERVKAWLQAVDSEWLSRFVREIYLSDKALSQGYRLEDVRSLLDWLRDEMDCDI